MLLIPDKLIYPLAKKQASWTKDEERMLWRWYWHMEHSHSLKAQNMRCYIYDRTGGLHYTGAGHPYCRIWKGRYD